MKDGEAYMQWYVEEVLATTMGEEWANGQPSDATRLEVPHVLLKPTFKLIAEPSRNQTWRTRMKWN